MRSFIEERVVFYGELFGLKDFKITVKWRTSDDDSYADCSALPEYRKAVIAFDLDKLSPLPREEVESTVRHELFHIITAPMRTALHSLWPKQWNDEWIESVEEKVVEDLAQMPLWSVLD